MKQLPCPISKSALLYGSHIAIETETFSLSYQELEKKVRSFQLYFKTLSIPSDNIGLIASNSINTILLYFAALREGFSVCMLNPKDPLSLQGEKIEELNLFLVRAPVVTPFSSLSLTTFIPADHLSTYLYTSGSSSKPKIAALSFQNHYYSALGILETLQMTSSSRVLLSLPLYHVSGISLVFRNFLSGATLVIPQDNVITTTLLEDKKISHVSLVFTQYSRLLNAFNKRILITLKAVLLGGSSFPSISLKKGIEKNLPLYLSYGLTEMSSAVCCNPLLKTHNIKSCGHLLPFRKLKIDKRGEILVSGKTLFKGYYCTKNQVLIPRKRWFKTKDLGIFFSKEGLFLQGRKDRLIITGGENIQPEEIEQILLSIEGVNQALILGLPDKEFGQKIVAVIRSDSFLCLDELANKLSQHLPRYKLPKAYLPWPKALESSSLKVSHILKEELFKYAATYISFSNNLNSS